MEFVPHSTISRDGFNNEFEFWQTVDFNPIRPERIYNPITAMGFSAMFTFQLDNTKR